MANKIFEHLLEEKIDQFVNSFSITSKKLFYLPEQKKFIHSGEFGIYREQICKEFLRFFIPHRLDIDHGFVINNLGEVSTQCDIIIYDRNITPLIENTEKQRFFPAEVVCGIGEIKSTISKHEFKTSLNKLARNKSIKEKTNEPMFEKRLRAHPKQSSKFDPVNFPFDNIFSFLICNKLDFNLDLIAHEINSFYNDDIESHQKHNLILSIQDGVLGYVNDSIFLMYPSANGNFFANRFVKPVNNKYLHFKHFTNYFFTGISRTTILFPQISMYFSQTEGGLIQDG